MSFSESKHKLQVLGDVQNLSNYENFLAWTIPFRKAQMSQT